MLQNKKDDQPRRSARTMRPITSTKEAPHQKT